MAGGLQYGGMAWWGGEVWFLLGNPDIEFLSPDLAELRANLTEPLPQRSVSPARGRENHPALRANSSVVAEHHVAVREPLAGSRAHRSFLPEYRCHFREHRSNFPEHHFTSCADPVAAPEIHPDVKEIAADVCANGADVQEIASNTPEMTSKPSKTHPNPPEIAATTAATRFSRRETTGTSFGIVANSYFTGICTFSME